MPKDIIITGCPRTGTSALSALLYHNENIFIANEMYAYHFDGREIFQGRVDMENPHLSRAMELKNMSKEDVLFLISQAREKYPVYPWVEQAMRQSMLLKLETFVLAATKLRFLEYAAEEGWDVSIPPRLPGRHKDIELDFFGDKNPEYCKNIRTVDYLSKNYPDAYYIICYRDPAPTIASFIRKSKAGHPEITSWFCDDVSTSIDQWMSYTSNWLHFLYPAVKNVKIIKYEDYCNNPEKLLHDLSIFLNQDINVENCENIYSPVNLDTYKDEICSYDLNCINVKCDLLHSRVMDTIQGAAS
jgi:hypothetical protein